MLHAWWPGGMVIGGLLAYAMTTALNASWELKLATIMVPAVIYLFMAVSLTYPQTERVASNVSTGQMWAEAAKPLFILLFVCMWMTAASELGPDQWFPTVMGQLVPQLQGVLFLVYTAGLMFVLRFYFSGWAHHAADSRAAHLLGAHRHRSVLARRPRSRAPARSSHSRRRRSSASGRRTSGRQCLASRPSSSRGAVRCSSRLMGGAGMLSVAVALPIMGAQIDQVRPGSGPADLCHPNRRSSSWFSRVCCSTSRTRGGYRAVQLPAVSHGWQVKAMTLAHLTLPTRDVERTVRVFRTHVRVSRAPIPGNSPVPMVWLDIGRGQQLHVLR